MLDQSQLADPRIGLAQAHSELLRQSHQPLARPVQQLGVGRERHRLRLQEGGNRPAGVNFSRQSRRVAAAAQFSRRPVLNPLKRKNKAPVVPIITSRAFAYAATRVKQLSNEHRLLQGACGTS